jgi:hypothetical protein
MDRAGIPRFGAPLLVVAPIVAASAAFGSWLPLLAALPWVAAIACFGARDMGAAREFPSAAETARERLWGR